MSNPSSDSYRNVTRYQGQDYSFAPRYLRGRDPTTNDIKPKEQQGYYPLGSLWTNSSNSNLWALANITSNLAKWVLIANTVGPLIKLGVPNGTSPITPDTNGLISFTSTGATVTITGSAGGLNAQNINFDVAGGAALTKVAVDAHTAPGTNPVIPSGTGQITLEGGATFATGTQANPIRTNSLAANTIDLQIQLAGSNAATSTPNDFGVSQFDANQFNVTSGFVQLKGGTTPPLLSLTGDDTVAVTPDTAGNIGLQGLVVANGTHAKAVFTESPSVHLEKIDVQLTAAIASTNVANVGLASFNNSQFIVDSNGFVSLGAFQSVKNIGINYASPTFTVNGADGTALSSTNPGFVTLQSFTNAGRLVQYRVTANQSFIDHTGASQITGNSFGVTNSGNVYSNDLPFFLYAVGNARAGGSPETIITFMISRIPGQFISPVAGKIAKSGSAVASTQGSFFALDSGITVADYASSPCLMIGSFRMQMPSLNDWTVQTLNFSGDGVGNFNENRSFTVASGSFGAASGKWFADNGGTAPGFTTSALGFYINRFGQCTVRGAFNTCNVTGIGAVTLLLALPYGTVDGGETLFGAFQNTAPSVNTIIGTNSTASLWGFQSSGSNNIALLINSNMSSVFAATVGLGGNYQVDPT